MSFLFCLVCVSFGKPKRKHTACLDVIDVKVDGVNSLPDSAGGNELKKLHFLWCCWAKFVYRSFHWGWSTENNCGWITQFLVFKKKVKARICLLDSDIFFTADPPAKHDLGQSSDTEAASKRSRPPHHDLRPQRQELPLSHDLSPCKHLAEDNTQVSSCFLTPPPLLRGWFVKKNDNYHNQISPHAGKTSAYLNTHLSHR